MIKDRFRAPNRREVVTGLSARRGVGATPTFGAAQVQTVFDQAKRSVSIPRQPQRIVSLYDIFITLPLYELGLPVIGSTSIPENDVYGLQELYGVSAEDAGIEIIGSGDGLSNFEMIASLKPDLIVADAIKVTEQDRLSKIAPVYFTDARRSDSDGFAILRDFSTLLSARTQYESLSQAYESRVEELRNRMMGFPKNPTYLGLIVPERLFVMQGFGALTQVLHDLGFRLPQEIAARSTAPFFAISPEELPMLDADLVMLMPHYRDKDQSPANAARAMSSFFHAWQSFLPAAIEERLIYFSSRLALIPTFRSAHRILDELEATEVFN